MPAWAVFVIGAAAVVSALGVLWQKVLRPLARGLAIFDRNVPVLLEIASQFRTDSGTSLRDVVNRLETAAVENRATNEALRVAVEGARLLAVADRDRVDRLLVLLAKLDAETVKKTAYTAAIEENTEANHANTEALDRVTLPITHQPTETTNP